MFRGLRGSSASGEQEFENVVRLSDRGRKYIRHGEIEPVNKQDAGVDNAYEEALRKQRGVHIGADGSPVRIGIVNIAGATVYHIPNGSAPKPQHRPPPDPPPPTPAA